MFGRSARSRGGSWHWAQWNRTNTNPRCADSDSVTSISLVSGGTGRDWAVAGATAARPPLITADKTRELRLPGRASMRACLLWEPNCAEIIGLRPLHGCSATVIIASPGVLFRLRPARASLAISGRGHACSAVRVDMDRRARLWGDATVALSGRRRGREPGSRTTLWEHTTPRMYAFRTSSGPRLGRLFQLPRSRSDVTSISRIGATPPFYPRLFN